MSKTNMNTSDAFKPMTVAEMTTTRGGTSWPDWLQNLIDQFEEVWELIEDQLPTDSGDLDDAYWDDLAAELEEAGYSPYSEEGLGDDW